VTCSEVSSFAVSFSFNLFPWVHGGCKKNYTASLLRTQPDAKPNKHWVWPSGLASLMTLLRGRLAVRTCPGTPYNSYLSGLIPARLICSWTPERKNKEKPHRAILRRGFFYFFYPRGTLNNAPFFLYWCQPDQRGATCLCTGPQ